ncbi:MAG: cupin domain-containing protein [Ignavibacteriae bacterium]|nr:MAG: cupin domain-containing protein [Ignavibacteriota bacterium]
MKRFVLALLIAGIFYSQGYAQYNSGVIVEPVLKTDTTSIGQLVVYPHFQHDEVTISKVTIPPGASTGWHKHSFPVFAYVVQGELSVELETGKTLQFPEHSCFAEVIETFHNGKNTGNENVVLIAFYMGEKGKPLSVPQQK